MKRILNHSICFLACILIHAKLNAQGKVVINEFMPWSGCNTTSEFIELMNFGPGPANIGCYIVTNGIYAVTIPENTIVQPGEYFVLSGQDILSQGCGNVDSAINVDLNWNTCNCTNIAVPTTGDGFLQNGGGVNEKVVLLDPSMNVVDAISRLSNPSSSNTITISANGGTCSSQTFNLDNMSVSYESVGNSAGIDNSFSRKLDGDCGWIKTTSISAGGPNKTNSTASASYQFNTVTATDCNSVYGSVAIEVSAENIAALFPMSYTLAFDADSNAVFDESDIYTHGIDDSPSSIEIGSLQYGRYRITLGTASSCNLRTFNFFIFNCYGVVLPVQLQYFKYAGIENNRHRFNYAVDDINAVKEIALEVMKNGSFHTAGIQKHPYPEGEQIIFHETGKGNIYRLKITDHLNRVIYSHQLITPSTTTSTKHWPNPVKNELNVELHSTARSTTGISVWNAQGMQLWQRQVIIEAGRQTIKLPVQNLEKGWYYLLVETAEGKRYSGKFIKGE